MANQRFLFIAPALIGLAIAAPSAVFARGASPYLPLKQSPRIERQIEKVLMLADKPVLRRPIAAATVLDALPRACEIDEALCSEVREYLQRYMKGSGITLLEVQAAASSGDSQRTLPNSRGEPIDSAWQAAVQAHYQVNDHLIVSAGAHAYDGDITPTGSMVSAGFDFAQLDIGFRDHWYSPMTDSSALISTQAPTMPSITLSNYRPLTALGLHYELFLAEMSKQEGIRYQGGTTNGRPRLTGVQLGMEPVSGYAVSINRVFQYGGGARGYGGLSGFLDAIYENSNQADDGTDEEFGNQVAALTSSILFPGRVPFAFRAEYAGEDNAYKGNYLLGATSLSLGVDFPRLWRHFDLTLEVSEWQRPWYSHHLYPRGLTNEDHVLGHWFGDERVFGDPVPGSSQMVRAGWILPSGDYLQARYRTLEFEPFGAVSYDRLQELSLNYSTSWKGRTIEAELSGGQDAFGESFGRLTLSADFAGHVTRRTPSSYEEDTDGSSTEVFVDAGAASLEARLILRSDAPTTKTDRETNAHVGIGARRQVSRRSDLGARLEIDQVNNYRLYSVRALDYRFRFTKRFAATAFFGAGRYDIGLPAHGYYWGAGLQWMDVFPNWDLSVDGRHHEKLGRDKMLPNDPPSTPDRTRMFFDVNSVSLYVSRRF